MQKYTVDISLNGENRKLILARQLEESQQHLAMKLVAYLMYFDRCPKVEMGVGQHYKPDLACVECHDVTLWVDCGDIGLHKLDRVTTRNHNAEIVVLKPTLRIAQTYKKQAERRIRRPERVTIVGFDPGFVDSFATVLSTRSSLAAAVDATRTMLEVNINGTQLKTQIHRL